MNIKSSRDGLSVPDVQETEKHLYTGMKEIQPYGNNTVF